LIVGRCSGQWSVSHVAYQALAGLPRAFGFVLATALSITAVGFADAKSRPGKTIIDEAPVLAAPAPMRFFTINSVLAKHDAKQTHCQRKPGLPRQLEGYRQ
jgi:hypothetical protein